ncbi:MAG: OmpA family protein, partial [Bacteroidales bacterium]|nr:OmpA family protein [Bacteroidales bacterium]
MLKKLFKMGVVVSILLASMSAYAQNTGKPEYPHYGFWSNWSIGGSFDLNNQAVMGGFGFGDKLGVSTSLGMDIFAQQKLNHAFDWRLRFALPGLFTAEKNGTASDGNTYQMDKHGSLTLDILFSINNAIKGYDPDRRFNLYIFAGGGLGLSFNPDSSIIDFGNVGITLDGGLGASYRFGDAHHIFAEYGYDINGDAPHPSTYFKNTLHHTNRIFRIGYYYCFGVTAADQAIAAQKAMLTQENFGALNTQVNNLENQVAATRNNEKKLENRIAELEDQLAEALKNQAKGNGAAADSLQAIIDQIKADQLNFYAMPFSVQYAVNDWKVSDEEMEKVKAVARVLKDNGDVKIMVVGFADYTGSDQYNMKLSEKRANEVKRLLVKKYGIAEDRISTDYKGKSVAFGDIQYALNRRVS